MSAQGATVVARNSRDWVWAWLMPIPFLLCFVIPFLTYVNPIPMLDPWAYFGLYQNLPEFIGGLRQGEYACTRLPHNLTGALFFEILPGVFANYALHLCRFMVSVWAFYATAKFWFGRRTALFAAIMLCFYPFFALQVSQDYVDATTYVFTFLTIFCLTKALSLRRPWCWLFFSGVVATGVIYTHLMTIVIFPSLFMYYVWGRRIVSRSCTLMGTHGNESEREAFGQFSCWTVGLHGVTFLGLGAACSTLVLCCYNYSVGGVFWFYGPSIGYVFHVSGMHLAYQVHFFEWLPVAKWLFLPLLALVMVIPLALRWLRPKNDSSVLYLFLTAAGLNFTFLGVLQAIDITTFPHAIYVNFAIPGVFMLLACFVRVPDTITRGLYILLFAAFVSGLSVSYYYGWWMVFHVGTGWLAGGVACCALVVAAWRYHKPMSRFAFGGLLIILVIVHAFTVETISASENSLGSAALNPWGRAVRSFNNSFHPLKRIARAVDVIGPYVRDYDFKFWYNWREPMGYEYICAAAAFMWAPSVINEDFPVSSIMEYPGQLARGAFKFKHGMALAIFHTEEDREARVNAALNEFGFKVKLIKRFRIDSDGAGYWLSVFQVVDPLLQEFAVTPRYVPTANLVFGIGMSSWADRPFPAWPEEHWTAVGKTNPLVFEPYHRGFLVTTGKSPWTYAVQYLPIGVLRSGTYSFWVRYRRVVGRPYFGILDRAGTKWVAHGDDLPGEDGTHWVFAKTHLKRGDCVVPMITNGAMRMRSQFVVQAFAVFCQPNEVDAGKSGDDDGHGVPLRLSTHAGGPSSATPIPSAEGWPLSPWKPCVSLDRMSFAPAKDGIVVTTPTVTNSYTIRYDKVAVELDGLYRFELGYRVVKGDIAFGLLSGDESVWLAPKGEVRWLDPEQAVQVVEIRLQSGDVVLPIITNISTEGASEIMVVSLKADYVEQSPTPRKGAVRPEYRRIPLALVFSGPDAAMATLAHGEQEFSTTRWRPSSDATTFALKDPAESMVPSFTWSASDAIKTTSALDDEKGRSVLLETPDQVYAEALRYAGITVPRDGWYRFELMCLHAQGEVILDLLKGSGSKWGDVRRDRKNLNDEVVLHSCEVLLASGAVVMPIVLNGSTAGASKVTIRSFRGYFIECGE